MQCSKLIIYFTFLAHTVTVESGPLSNMSSMINNSPKNIDVTVSGSSSLQDISEVRLVNDVNFQTYADLVVKRSNPGYVRGHKIFKGQVNVNKDFNGRILNDFPLERLMNEALSKSEDQLVGGRHIFGDLFTGKIFYAFFCIISLNHAMSVEVSAGFYTLLRVNSNVNN